MKIVYSLIALLLMHQPLCADTMQVTGKNLRFSVPEEVTFESKEQMEMYSFKWGEGTTINLLMLYPQPMPNPAKMVKPMADMMEISFEENLGKENGLELISTEREHVDWGHFSGEQLAAKLKSADGFELVNYMFILHDGERIWNGQLSGAGETGIEQAIAIISSAQRIEPTEQSAETK